MEQLRAEGAIKGGVKPPPQKVEAPDIEVPSCLSWVTSAFIALSRSRLVNETGAQPLLFTEIKAYCDLAGIFREEDRSDLLTFISALDIVYLKHSHAKIEKGREEAARKAKQEAERRNRNRQRNR